MSDETEREAGARAGGHRAIVDAPSLQALAHPTRLALIEAIGMAGAMTATQASRVVGESPTACAYHLRMLARLGFIEEAGGGHGRERPWRRAQAGMSFDDNAADPAVARAAGALNKTLTERFIGRIRSFELAKSRYPDEVTAATGVVQSVVFATPDELRQLRADLLAVLTRHIDRLDPALRPLGSRAFEVVAFIHLFDTRDPHSVQGASHAEPPADS
jgi:DNA-binding transcriptional ArsR family regulator